MRTLRNESKRLHGEVARWNPMVMYIVVRCEDCGTVFAVDGGVVHRMAANVDGLQYFFVYYDCPHCGMRHFVQVDDTKSQQMLARLTCEMAKLRNVRARGKSFNKKQQRDFNAIRTDLSKYRNALMEQLTGKQATDAAGNAYVLRFVSV